MKTKIIIAAVTFAALFSLSASAQCPKKDCDKCPKQEQMCSAKDSCMRPEMRRGHQQMLPNAFEGIELTEQQKASLKALRTQEKGKRDGRKEYLGKVKEILTPEQYVTFLENIATSRPMGRPGGR